MTDRERLKEFLDSMGIAYSDQKEGVVFGKSIHGEKFDKYPASDRVDGYPGFYCQWEFSDDGQFEKVGVWE